MGIGAEGPDVDAAIRYQMVALLPRLRRFARALAGATDGADDLVQATCERALAAIDRWVPGTRLDSWMFRIMHNHWIDEVRRRGVPTAPLAEDDGIAGEDGRRVAEARLELRSVAARIAGLPEAQ